MQAMLPEANSTTDARDAEFRAVALPLLPAVARLARVLVPQQADADDVVQDTFLRAYRYWHTFREGSDCLRCVPHAAARDAGLEHMFDRLDLGPAIANAIASLAPVFREVVVLSDVEGLGYEEVALNLNIL